MGKVKLKRVARGGPERWSGRITRGCRQKKKKGGLCLGQTMAPRRLKCPQASELVESHRDRYHFGGKKNVNKLKNSSPA